MPLVEFPNGERVEFPDDMSDDDVSSAAASYWSGKQKGQMGPAERFGYGAGNVAYGLAQMAAHALPPEARGVMARPLPKLEQEIKARQVEYEARKPEGFDIAKMAGEVAATLPLAIAGGGITGGIATGALAGMAQPSTADEDSYWQSKLQQAGMGAAGGAVAGVAGKVIGKVVSGAANPAAKELVKEGVTPTVGQAVGPMTATVEEKLTSMPFLGSAITRGRERAIESMNVAAYNRALKPIGQKASGVVGHEGVEEVQQHLSRAFEEIAPKLTLHPNTLQADVAGAVEKAADMLPEKELGRLGEILVRARSKPNFKEAEEYIGHFATRYGSAPDPDTRALGDSLQDVLEQARDSLAKQNPAYASRLRAINEGWANYAIIRKAASESGTREGVFSPEKLNSAVKSQAMRKGTSGLGQFAGGQALMQDLSRPAMRVLGKKYPDSGSAGRAALVGAGLGYFRPEALAVAAGAAIPYASPLLRRAAAAAVLKRPIAMRVAGEGAEMLGRVSAPGVGLVLSQAGAP